MRESSVLAEKSGPVGPSVLLCDQDSSLSLVLGNCYFQPHMFHLGMSNSNLAFGTGDFYC